MWQEIDNKLTKEYKFSNFTEAIKFINKISEAAESLNHHPDIYLHNYNQVRVDITTHDAGKITEKDYLLSDKISNLG